MSSVRPTALGAAILLCLLAMAPEPGAEEARQAIECAPRRRPGAALSLPTRADATHARWRRTLYLAREDGPPPPAFPVLSRSAETGA